MKGGVRAGEFLFSFLIFIIGIQHQFRLIFKSYYYCTGGGTNQLQNMPHGGSDHLTATGIHIKGRVGPGEFMLSFPIFITGIQYQFHLILNCNITVQGRETIDYRVRRVGGVTT